MATNNTATLWVIWVCILPSRETNGVISLVREREILYSKRHTDWHLWWYVSHLKLSLINYELWVCVVVLVLLWGGILVTVINVLSEQSSFVRCHTNEEWKLFWTLKKYFPSGNVLFAWVAQQLLLSLLLT